ncbi:HTH_48 domain-containing protein [Trichonephila clavipes]|nr:HTH_48 domain-containing protein [Trichonephila clavipes]
MFKVTESPAKCEIRSVTRFLTARNMSAADIHHQIIEVYGTEGMSDSQVQKWVRKFKDERTNVHHEERSAGSSVITDDLMQAVETKVRENMRFTITTLSMELVGGSRLMVYKIVTDDLIFKKLCSRWILIFLTPEHKQKRFGRSLDFLIRYKEEEDEILSRI